MRAHRLDFASFEALRLSAPTRELVLRLVCLSRSGGLVPFVEALARDETLDPETSAVCAELACDARFLRAFEDYMRRTQDVH